jgi:nucleoside 2-deoxyribosyltransferase
VIVDQLAASGYKPIDPWTLSDDLAEQIGHAHQIEKQEQRNAELHRLSMMIANRNSQHLASSYGVLAVLDGVDVDSGTASEIGYAFGLGNKIINGLRTDFRLSGENTGVSINLQVQYWIEHSGGTIIHSVDQINTLPF